MKKLALTILVLSTALALLIVACGQATPDPGAIQTALAQTLAAQPPTSTNVPQPTYTQISTNIQEPSKTMTRKPIEFIQAPISGKMVLIPAGEFQMGCDDGNLYEGVFCLFQAQPLHTVYLDAYTLPAMSITPYGLASLG